MSLKSTEKEMSKSSPTVNLSGDTNYYEPGSHLVGDRVYLGFCAEELFYIQPWKTKEIYSHFNQILGSKEYPYVHISVLEDEWRAWMDHVDNKKPLPPGYRSSEIETDDGDEEVVDESISEEVNAIAKLMGSKPRPKSEPRPKPQLKKETIEWQMKSLIKLLRKREKVLRKEKRAERKSQQKKTFKKVHTKTDIAANTPLPAFVKPKLELDPNIDKYQYNLLVEVHGTVKIRTKDLHHHIEISSATYPARLDDGWVMIRSDQTEYGLLVRQWKQYERGDMETTVIIHGLE